MNWIDIEYAIVLGFYKFDNYNSIAKQTDLAARMSVLTGISRNRNAISNRLGNYMYIDPDYTGAGLASISAWCLKAFKEYIDDDPSLEKLATIYSNFLNGVSLSKLTVKPASKSVAASSKTRTVTSVVYNREPLVKQNTLLRASGKCEFCNCVAPFIKEDGEPYLEVHHYVPLSEGGADATNNTLALCPNCHRRFHYGPKITQKDKKE